MRRIWLMARLLIVPAWIGCLAGCSGGSGLAASNRTETSAASSDTPSASSSQESTASSDSSSASSTTDSSPPQGTSSTIMVQGVPTATVAAGTSYLFTPWTTDSSGNAVSFSIQNKPSWASFSVATGSLSGTPTSSQTGTYSNIVISASDGAASASLPSFSIQVQGGSNPPVSSASSALANSDSWTLPNAGAAQGFTATPVCTSALTGAHHTYNIGAANSPDTFDTVPWGALVAGDVVNVYPGTYHINFGLRAQGTAANPVVINGVSDSACNKPVIDGTSSHTAKGTNLASVQYGEQLGVVVIARNTSTDAYGSYEPQYIVIQGLQIQGGANGTTFTASTGASATRADAACLWVQQGMHILVRNNVLSGCGFGFFTMAKDGLLSEAAQFVWLANNRIYGNGSSGSYLDHNVYMQANAPVEEGNYFGTLVAGAQGSSFKSRSAQDIFRYNSIDCAARCIDLVQSEDQASGIAVLPYYGTDYVYGNTIHSSGPEAIHYGGDNLGEQNSGSVTSKVFVPPASYRKHLLFWNNSYTLTTSNYEAWLIAVSALSIQADVWGNSWNLAFSGDGQLSWLEWAGTLRLGGNLVTGTQPANAQTASGGLTTQFSVTTGAPTPTDQNLTVLN